MRLRTIAAACVLGIGGPAPVAAAAQVDAAVAEAIALAKPGDRLAVIIRHSDGATLPAPGTSRAGLVRALRQRADTSLPSLEAQVRGLGGDRPRRLWLLNAVSARLPATAVDALSRLPGVQSIELDGAVSEPATPAGTSSTLEWNLGTVRAPDLWSVGIIGDGVVVGLIDSGVDAAHPDLSARWRGGANSWFDPHGEHTTPYDASGHGTSVAGLMVGGSAGGSAVGIAPGARWIAAKIFDDDGNAAYSDIHAAFQWMLDPDDDPDTDDAPAVVNNSWGLLNTAGKCVDTFAADIAALKAAGIAVVFSAGNDGPWDNTSDSPANDPASLSVGATGQSDATADFSSRGASACDQGLYPLLSAPGVDLRVPDITLGGAIPLSYAYVSGTSFAAPHVSGALALLRQAFPDKTAAELQQALFDTAFDIGTAGADNSSGHGRLDVMAAYTLLQGGGTTTLPGDADGDGWTVAAGDCADNDPAIHPGATEIRSDGKDQDCNGYDLTIVISTASYNKRRATLTVEATSNLGKAAALEVAGYGAMSWSSSRKRWSLTVRRVSTAPTSVTVTGVEGSATTTPSS